MTYLPSEFQLDLYGVGNLPDILTKKVALTAVVTGGGGGVYILTCP